MGRAGRGQCSKQDRDLLLRASGFPAIDVTESPLESHVSSPPGEAVAMTEKSISKRKTGSARVR